MVGAMDRSARNNGSEWCKVQLENSVRLDWKMVTDRYDRHGYALVYLASAVLFRFISAGERERDR